MAYFLNFRTHYCQEISSTKTFPFFGNWSLASFYFFLKMGFGKKCLFFFGDKNMYMYLETQSFCATWPQNLEILQKVDTEVPKKGFGANGAFSFENLKQKNVFLPF